MRKLSWVSIVVALVVLLSGCDRDKLMSRLVPPDDAKAAKTYIGLLKAQQFDQLEQDVDPATKARYPNLHALLLDMAAKLPPGDPISEKVVSFSSFTGVSNGEKRHTSNTTFEYQYPHETLLVNVGVLTRDGASFITGMNVRKLDDSLEHLNRFGLSGKTALQYVVLAAAIVAPLLSIYALIVCVRSRLRGKRWPWILFILVGVTSFSINWTTGAWTFHPVYVQLLSAGAHAPPYGAWIISVSLPLGAIWFLLQRKALSVASD
jgi:hypothetical protein